MAAGLRSHRRADRPVHHHLPLRGNLCPRPGLQLQREAALPPHVGRRRLQGHHRLSRLPGIKGFFCSVGDNVKDSGCLSRILILPIPDLGSRIQKQQQTRGVKKISCHTFLCSHKFHKIENYFNFEVLRKKIWADFQRIKELFTKKIVSTLSSQKYGFGIRDPGSGKNPIPDPGVKKAPDPRSGSATLVGDPDADPYVFGPSGSITTRFGSGSGAGSFYHQ